MTTAIAVVIDASVVAALGLIACRVRRRRPASLRHMILAASLAAAAIAPILEATVPHWEFPVLASASQATASGSSFGSSVPSMPDSGRFESPEASSVTWTTALVAVWAIGVLVVMAGLVAGLFRLVAMTRRCRPVQSALWREHAEALSMEHGLTRPPVILESSDRAVLLTWGLFRPRIIVPSGARSWTAERIEVVLAHECAHIARRDWALHIAAEVVRAAYWFNPLIWIACRRQRDESEQACDDAVLRRGIAAADYASHLLAVARHVITVDRGWASAPAVANASTLERRVSAMLNASRNRQPLTAAARAVTVLAALAVTIPVAAVTLIEDVGAATISPAVLQDVVLSAPAVTPAPDVPVMAASASRVASRPDPSGPIPAPRAARPVPLALPRAAAAPAQQQPATVSGVITDPSGGVLPGVMVTVVDSSSGMKYSAVTDVNGAFAVKNLPPARYEFRATLPGFATLAQDLTLGSGEARQSRLMMRVGSLSETVAVVCPVGGGARAPRAAAVFAFDSRPAATRLFAQQGVPVRIGGQIAAPRQSKRVTPVCPDSQIPADGYIVILEGTIGADGLVKDVTTLRPKPGDQQTQEFVKAAIDAVRQWEYTPTRLNNVPTPVIMTVTVAFRRQ